MIAFKSIGPDTYNLIKLKIVMEKSMTKNALGHPFRSNAAWKGPELSIKNDWIYTLNTKDIIELERALSYVKSKNLKIPNFSQKDFPLPTLSKILIEILKELEHGRGLKLIRGIPVEKFNEEDAITVYWGICSYLGEAVAQNMMGELLGHVRAVGSNWNENFNLRGYQTPVHLPYHCDKSDVVGLLCLQTAKIGGTSSIASSIAIHNEILKTRPDLLEELYKPFYIDHRGEEFAGDDPFYIAQVFSIYKGRFFGRFGQKYVESAQRFSKVPRLTEKQIEAMNLFSKLALSEDMRLDMTFKRGDLQLLNNHYTVHSRTEYEDYKAESRRRHLIRILLFTESNKDVPKYIEKLNAFIRRWGEEPRKTALSGNTY